LATPQQAGTGIASATRGVNPRDLLRHRPVYRGTSAISTGWKRQIHPKSGPSRAPPSKAFCFGCLVGGPGRVSAPSPGAAEYRPSES